MSLYSAGQLTKDDVNYLCDGYTRTMIKGAAEGQLESGRLESFRDIYGISGLDWAGRKYLKPIVDDQRLARWTSQGASQDEIRTGILQNTMLDSLVSPDINAFYSQVLDKGISVGEAIDFSVMGAFLTAAHTPLGTIGKASTIATVEREHASALAKDVEHAGEGNSAALVPQAGGPTIVSSTSAEAVTESRLPQSGTVFDSIKATQAVIPGTSIPKSFELNVDGKTIWVNPNATKHMGEYLTRNGLSYSTTDGSQAMLTSLQSAVKDAFLQGLKFNEKVQVGRWELVFSQRSTDPYPVLKHALYK